MLSNTKQTISMQFKSPLNMYINLTITNISWNGSTWKYCNHRDIVVYDPGFNLGGCDKRSTRLRPPGSIFANPEDQSEMGINISSTFLLLLIT